MRYKHFIFDIDGTLVCTEKTAILSLQQTIHDLMGKDLSYEETYRFFGIPSHKVAGFLGYPDLELFAQTWESEFIARRNFMSMYPGVEAMLHELRRMGIHLGVVTSRSRFEVENDTLFKEISDCFEVVITSEDSAHHKPDPDPIYAYIAKASAFLGKEVRPQECIYLGDTMHDYGCSHSAGCDFALADWGGKGWQGIDADYHFTNAEGVLAIARGLRKRLVILAAEQAEYEMCLKYMPGADCILMGVGAGNVIKTLSGLREGAFLVNIGYAGSNSLEVGTVTLVSESCRLMTGSYMFTDHANPLLLGGQGWPCFTANDFVTSTDRTTPTLFDMELNYIAAFAFRHEALVSIKTVSDALDIDAFRNNALRESGLLTSPEVWNRVKELFDSIAYI